MRLLKYSFINVILSACPTASFRRAAKNLTFKFMQKSRVQHRRSIRLKDYDYSEEGGYFVTICTYNMECVFGEIVNEEMRLSSLGTIASKCWVGIPNHFENIELDKWVVMLNHIHGVLIFRNKKINHSRGLINQTPTKQNLSAPTPKWVLMKSPKLTLGKIIRHYKARTSKMIHDAGYQSFRWQRNYWEHVIRDGNDLTRINEYIMNNEYDGSTTKRILIFEYNIFFSPGKHHL